MQGEKLLRASWIEAEVEFSKYVVYIVRRYQIHSKNEAKIYVPSVKLVELTCHVIVIHFTVHHTRFQYPPAFPDGEYGDLIEPLDSIPEPVH